MPEGAGGPGFGLFGFPFAPPQPPPGARRRRGSRQSGPKPQWSLPPPPGLTLRERVEKRERELGLRCSDVSCGLGPTDEDPEPVGDVRNVGKIGVSVSRKVDGDGKGKERETVNTEAGGEKHVCDHRFHPACLVSAERVAGWGDSMDVKEERESGEDEEVEVSCPVCRAVGSISRTEWDEGARSLA